MRSFAPRTSIAPCASSSCCRRPRGSGANAPGSRGERLRLALEELGPIFMKFGQMLSTRRDLLPRDVADELEKLQDRVPPFPGAAARQLVETAYGRALTDVFARFEESPLAAATIAQVHPAQLKDGKEVVVKVVRPGIRALIKRDIEVLYALAHLANRYWSDAHRLRPIDLVREYEKTILDELDLMREAANAAQLRRNFADSQPAVRTRSLLGLLPQERHGDGARARRADQRHGGAAAARRRHSAAR